MNEKEDPSKYNLDFYKVFERLNDTINVNDESTMNDTIKLINEYKKT